MKWKPYAYARKTTAECRLDSPLAAVAKILIDEDIGSVLVKDSSGRYCGLLTDKLIFKAIAGQSALSHMVVGDLDLEPIVFASKNASMGEVMLKFMETPSNRLVMVDDHGKVVGVLKKKNLDRFALVKHAVKRILRKN
jgi:CBS domain-containing protein